MSKMTDRSWYRLGKLHGRRGEDSLPPSCHIPLGAWCAYHQGYEAGLYAANWGRVGAALRDTREYRALVRLCDWLERRRLVQWLGRRRIVEWLGRPVRWFIDL